MALTQHATAVRRCFVRNANRDEGTVLKLCGDTYVKPAAVPCAGPPRTRITWEDAPDDADAFAHYGRTFGPSPDPALEDVAILCATMPPHATKVVVVGPWRVAEGWFEVRRGRYYVRAREPCTPDGLGFHVVERGSPVLALGGDGRVVAVGILASVLGAIASLPIIDADVAGRCSPQRRSPRVGGRTTEQQRQQRVAPRGSPGGRGMSPTRRHASPRAARSPPPQSPLSPPAAQRLGIQYYQQPQTLSPPPPPPQPASWHRGAETMSPVRAEQQSGGTTAYGSPRAAPRCQAPTEARPVVFTDGSVRRSPPRGCSDFYAYGDHGRCVGPATVAALSPRSAAAGVVASERVASPGRGQESPRRPWRY